MENKEVQDTLREFEKQDALTQWQRRLQNEPEYDKRQKLVCKFLTEELGMEGYD